MEMEIKRLTNKGYDKHNNHGNRNGKNGIGIDVVESTSMSWTAC